MANVELYQKVVDAIHNDPNSHNQGTWAEKTPCGTSYCFAGWAVVLSGEEIIWNSPCPCEDCEDLSWASHCRDTEGFVHHISFRASELLGIPVKWNDRSHAEKHLFEGRNTIHDLHCYVKDITDGKVVGPSL